MGRMEGSCKSNSTAETPRASDGRCLPLTARRISKRTGCILFAPHMAAGGLRAARVPVGQHSPAKEYITVIANDGTKGLRKNYLAFSCRLPGPMARRERRTYFLACKERATKPAGLGAASHGGAAPCICPPGARAKVQTLFITRPLLWRKSVRLVSVATLPFGADSSVNQSDHVRAGFSPRPVYLNEKSLPQCTHRLIKN